MASAVNSLFGTGAANAAAGSGSTTSGNNASSASTAPSEQVFLQLLVSQIQNQDPLNPADGTQFVTQLAQFSELEQVIGIRGDIETQMSTAQEAAAAAASGTTTNPDANGSSATGSATPAPSGTTETSKT